MHIVARYVLLFITYSFLGAVVETLYRLATEHQLYGIHGFLNLPILPIYGFGALAIVVLLGRIRNPVALFVVGALLTTIIEFATHWVLEVFFDMKIWGYDSEPFNLDGRISLLSSIGFGVASVTLVRMIHPALVGLLNRLSKRVAVLLAAIVLIVLLTDVVTSIIERVTV